MGTSAERRLWKRLSIDSLCTLAMERERREGWTGENAAPQWDEFVGVPRVRELLSSWIEDQLSFVMGREISFKSASDALSFLRGHGEWRPYIADREWLIAQALGDGQGRPSILDTFRGIGVDPLALALGKYTKYEQAIAAALQSLAEAPEQFWKSGLRVPPAHSNPSEFDVCQPVRVLESQSRRNKFEGRRQLEGGNWIEVYRRVVNETRCSPDAVKKRAARGRVYLNEESPVRLKRFYAPQLKPLLRDLHGYKGFLDYRWLEIWIINRRAREQNLRIPIRSVSKRMHFQGIEFFRLM